MKKTTLQKIEEMVAHCQGIPSAVIEYNLELPKHKDIKKDKFFGVKAKFEPLVKDGELQMIYMSNNE